MNGATERIRLLSNKYADVSRTAELPMRAERTRSVANKIKAGTQLSLDLQFFAEFSTETNAKMFAQFKKDFVEGRINTKLKWHKQREHIAGTKEHLERIRRDVENGKTPASYFYEDVDINSILQDHMNKGEFWFRNQNEKFPNEYITLEKPIGKVYNIGEGKYIETRRIQIKYSKDGVHVFPVKER